MKERFSPIRITAVYVIFGMAWILFSDTALLAVIQNAELLSLLPTIKGWIFILVTGALVYWLTNQMANELKRKNLESQQSESE